MDKALGGYQKIRLTTFTAEKRDKGRGAINHTEPTVTDGDVAVQIQYRGVNNRQNNVYVALVDVDTIAAELRRGVDEEYILDSVQLRHIPSGFDSTCPVCGKSTVAQPCNQLRQWLLPSPALSLDKSTQIHVECCEEFADALEQVWQHTADGLASSL